MAPHVSDPTTPIITDPAFNVKVKQVHENVEQELIVTTVDKAELCIRKMLSDFEQSRSWIAPLGIAITLSIVFPTTHFKDWLLPGYTWQALFIVATVLSLAWLIRCLLRRKKSPSVEEILTSLMKARN